MTIFVESEVFKDDLSAAEKKVPRKLNESG
jgi:hypothetical protein